MKELCGGDGSYCSYYGVFQLGVIGFLYVDRLLGWWNWLSCGDLGVLGLVGGLSFYSEYYYECREIK